LQVCRIKNTVWKLERTRLLTEIVIIHTVTNGNQIIIMFSLVSSFYLLVFLIGGIVVTYHTVLVWVSSSLVHCVRKVAVHF
jgi:hypothetical protein